MPTEKEARRRVSAYFLVYARQLDDDYLNLSQKSALKKFALEWKSIKVQMDWAFHESKTSESRQFLSDLLTSSPYCLDYFMTSQERKVFLEEALSIARDARDTLTESKLLGDLGLTYSGSDDFVQAASFQRQRIVLARELGDEKGESIALNNLGDDYNSLSYRLGYLPTAFVVSNPQRDMASFPLYPVQALRCFKQAYRLSRKRQMTAEQARALHWAGLAYLNMNFFRSARDHLYAALKIIDGVHVEVDKARILMGVAYYHRQLGINWIHKRKDFQISLDFYTQAYEHARVSESPLDEMICLEALGQAYVRTGDDKKAIEIFQEGLEKSRQFNLKFYEIEFLVALAIRYELVDAHLSLEMLKKAHVLSQESGSFSVNIVRTMALICWRDRRLEEAAAYFEQTETALYSQYGNTSLLVSLLKFMTKHPRLDRLFFGLLQFSQVSRLGDIFEMIAHFSLGRAENRYYKMTGLHFSRSLYVNVSAKITEFTLRIQKQPSYWYWYVARGLARSANDDDLQALSDIKRAIELAPHQLDVYLALSDLNFYQCSSDEIIDLLSQGILHFPKYAILYLHRGQAYYQSGQYNEAAQDFKIAIERHTKKIYAHSHLALALFRNGQVGASDEWFEKARMASRRSEDVYLVNYDHAVRSFLEGDWEDGLSWLRAACRSRSYAVIELLYADLQHTNIFDGGRNKKEFKELLIEFVA